MVDDIIVSNCRPPKNVTPTDNQIAWCRPNLTRILKELQPELIIPMGHAAVKSLIGPFWREEVGPITRWAGWRIPSRVPNAWICPNYHPSYVARSLKNRLPVVQVIFERYLRKALKLAGKGRPWQEIPDYTSQVRVEFDPDRAAKVVRQLVKGHGLLAFDLESNMLKPDHPEAKIYCCSVSDGETTISYPWIGEAIQATKELILSPVPKVGANLKHEHRWMLKEFGEAVRNWDWDVVTTAHTLDNRRGVAGVKFQGYVLFGQPDYDSHIKPYLRAKGSNVKNRIHQLDMREVLTYCGMDSLMEILIAKKQEKFAYWRK